MPVYVDNARHKFGRMTMCHLIADSMAELLDMVDRIGVDRRWFQSGSHPHFDICASKRALAVKAGAIEVDRHGVVAAMKRHRVKWMAEPAEVAAIQAARAAAHKATGTILGHPKVSIEEDLWSMSAVLRR
jgi:hypothetical protein